MLTLHISNNELIQFFNSFEDQSEIEKFLGYAMNLFNYFRKKPDRDELLSLLSDVVSQNNEKLVSRVSQIGLDSATELTGLMKYKLLELTTGVQQTVHAGILEHERLGDIHNKVTELSESFRSNSSRKGEYSQYKFLDNLYTEFPEHEIIDTSDQSAACDFQLKHNSHPTVFIELKNYTSNVPKREIEKFHRDLALHKSSGVLVSISSGISNKSDFTFEIVENRVLFYLCNNGFDTSRLRFAVSVIYNLTKFLEETNDPGSISITPDLILRIKEEYSRILSLKESMTSKLKEVIRDLQKIELNAISNLLIDQKIEPTVTKATKATKATTVTVTLDCDICKKTFKTKSGLAKHSKIQHQP